MIKCEQCDFEAQNENGLRLHMKKHKSNEPDPRYATKEDIQSINSSLEKLTSIIIEDKRPQVVVPSKEIKIDENADKPEKAVVPPKWRAMVDEVLGPDFGINVVYPDTGGGFLFKIIVPLEKSNASSAHKEFYKSDIRTCSISYQNGIEGIKKFCERVAANLKKK